MNNNKYYWIKLVLYRLISPHNLKLLDERARACCSAPEGRCTSPITKLSARCARRWPNGYVGHRLRAGREAAAILKLLVLLSTVRRNRGGVSAQTFFPRCARCVPLDACGPQKWK